MVPTPHAIRQPLREKKSYFTQLESKYKSSTTKASDQGTIKLKHRLGSKDRRKELQKFLTSKKELSTP